MLCAIFSPIFKTAKYRLKCLLSNKMIYADGLRPDEIYDSISQITGSHDLWENDLSKQDR